MAGKQVKSKSKKLWSVKGTLLGIGFLLLTLCSALPSLSADQLTERPDAVSSRSFDVSYVMKVEPAKGTHKVRIWVPLPSSDEFQSISLLQLEGSGRFRIRREPKYGNRYGYLLVDASHASEPLNFRLTFHVTRYEDQLDLKALAMGKSGLLPKRVILFLQRDDAAPRDLGISRLVAEQTAGMSEPFEKAGAIYNYVRSQDPSIAFGRKPECDWDESNCLDLSLFVAMARTAGIPARFATGLSLPGEQKQGTILKYHTWAEFYLGGIGWIPLEALEASQYPKNALAGGEERVVFSVGQAIADRRSLKRGAADSLVYPHVEADGRSSDRFSVDVFFQETGIYSVTPSATSLKKLIFADGSSVTRAKGHFPS